MDPETVGSGEHLNARVASIASQPPLSQMYLEGSHRPPPTEKPQKQSDVQSDQIDPALLNIDYANGYIDEFNVEPEEEKESKEVDEVEHLIDFNTWSSSGSEQKEEMSYEGLVQLDPIIRKPNHLTIDQFPEKDSNYIYSDRPTAAFSRYEPQVVREAIAIGQRPAKHYKKRKLQGLCAFCQTEPPPFYDIDSSAYLHHMMISHGVFSNGNVVRDPYLVENGGIECPYDGCFDRYIKSPKKDMTDPQKYKAYCRHVRLFHYEGKNV